MEIVKAKWGLKLKSPDFYKKIKAKTHSIEEWHEYIDKNIEEVNYSKRNNLPFSERCVVVRLYRFSYTIIKNI